MTESKFSFNCYLDHEDGYGGQMTVRGETSEELAANWDAMAAELSKRGYRRSLRKEGAPKTEEPKADAPKTSQPNTTNTSLSFDATEIAVSATDGKTYYKVKGGKYAKFGVTVWPEVLTEAGFDLAGLVAGQNYSLDHIARYEEWDKDGKTQRKVVALQSK